MSDTTDTYAQLGRQYAQVRRADPRIEQAILNALGSAANVVNVGAGTVIRGLSTPDRAPDVVPVLVPADCTDGFLAAHWRKPHAYLDPRVRAGMSGSTSQPGHRCERRAATDRGPRNGAVGEEACCEVAT